MYSRIIKFNIYTLVFLLPLFFLPFSYEAFEFNKQYLLFFLISLSVLAWLAKMVLVDKELRFRTSPLDVFVLVFLAAAVLSAVFSVDKSSSLFGFYGRFSDGMIGLLSLAAFYFLITNNAGVGKDATSGTIDKIIKVFLFSVSLVVLSGYFSIFGVWLKLNGILSLPPIMLQTFFNTTSGSMEGLAVFLAVVSVFLIGRILVSAGKSRNVVNYLLVIAIFPLLAIIDFNPAWLTIFLSLILFLAVVLRKRTFKEDINKLLLPILFIVLSLVFLFINASDMQGAVLKYYLPQEQVLQQGTSWSVALKSATENVKSAFLGSGPGTFHYGFAKFRPLELNQKDFWQFRFDRSGSHLAEVLGTTGFIGLLSYVALLAIFLFISYHFLQRNKNGIPLLMAFLALLVGQFVYHQNTVLAFSFWLVLGLTAVNWQKTAKEKTISFKDFPELSLIFSILLIILVLLAAFAYFFAGRFYVADAYYRNYLESERIEKLEKAANLNPGQPQYKLIAARDHLNKLIIEGQKPADQMDQNAVLNNIYSALTYLKGGLINGVSVKGAVELSPNRAAIWETLGVIYRTIQGTAEGASEWAVNSFEKAIDLEPTNPVLHTELGKIYLSMGDSAKAKEKFDKAKELKPDYTDASIQLSLLYESQGDLTEAVRQMEDLAKLEPYDTDVLFQLGRLYLNDGRTDEAIFLLESIIKAFPNHSNSLYSLGLAYQNMGQKEKAMAYFEKVLELNPGNAEITARIEELRSGAVIAEE